MEESDFYNSGLTEFDPLQPFENNIINKYLTEHAPQQPFENNDSNYLTEVAPLQQLDSKDVDKYLTELAQLQQLDSKDVDKHLTELVPLQPLENKDFGNCELTDIAPLELYENKAMDCAMSSWMSDDWMTDDWMSDENIEPFYEKPCDGNESFYGKRCSDDNELFYGKRCSDDNESCGSMDFKRLHLDNDENKCKNKRKKLKKRRKTRKEKENNPEFEGITELVKLISKMCNSADSSTPTDAAKVYAEKMNKKRNRNKTFKMRTKYHHVPTLIWHSDSNENVGKALAEQHHTDFLIMKHELDTYGRWNDKTIEEKYLVITKYKLENLPIRESLRRPTLLLNARKHLARNCD
ncbi:uncharacterized protein LOC111620716 [Centruroides sculpturatus]|uniref:uncharacterized protein LOC111620716 n=1 Tax=Centruroides sculpturatus TaxID=218467 RepID=UPI000C6E43B0|nr:uncharacterized protein LOC111620716 [Centruroides sculpturatus]